MGECALRLGLRLLGYLCDDGYLVGLPSIGMMGCAETISERRAAIMNDGVAVGIFGQQGT